MAVIIFAKAIDVVAFHPNSRSKIVNVAKQGINNILTNASIINWIGVNMAARLVPNRATSMRSVNSFLTAPNMRTTPAITGRPNQTTVMGAKKLAIGVSNPKAYNP